MAFGFMKSVAAPIAVDFGVSRLKVLQLQAGAGEGGPTLAAIGSREVPLNLSEKPAERLQWQAQALGEVLKEGGFKGKRAVCSVSSVHSYAQHVQVAKEAGKKVSDCVAEELRSATGRDPSTLITRHFEVGEVNRGGTKRTEVVCFAIPREAVVAHMRALKSCRLEPVGVHTEHMALVRSMDRLHAGEGGSSGATLILDLGYSSTKVTVSHGRELVLARTMAVGGKQIAAGETGLERAGSGTSGGAGSTGVGTAVAEAPAAVNQELTILADELGQCVRYYQALFPDKKIERTVFVGGEARRTEVCRALARSLRVAAQVADPLAGLARAPGFVSSGVEAGAATTGWAVPLGLCALPIDL